MSSLAASSLDRLLMSSNRIATLTKSHAGGGAVVKTRRKPAGQPPLRTPQTGGGGPLDKIAKRLGPIAIGATIGYKLPDWVGAVRNRLTPAKPVEEKTKSCELHQLVSDELENLKLDSADQQLKALPKRDHAWELPSGHVVKVKQGYSKDGLSLTAELRGPDGKVLKAGDVPLSAAMTKKGAKVKLAEWDWSVHGENFGKLALEARVDGKGLNEAQVTFTTHEGLVTTYKLKPKFCNLDLTFSNLVRMNQGSSADARRWVDVYLAQAGSEPGGLAAGVDSLLLQAKPAASGRYLNHGSEAYDLVTRPLNLLRGHADFSRLDALQREARAHPERRTQLQAQARDWLTHSLQSAIEARKLDALSLRNAFGLDYGVPAVTASAGPVAPRSGAAQAPQSRVQIDWRKLKQEVGAAHPMRQIADGRLFVSLSPTVLNSPMSNSKEYRDNLTEKAARALGQKPGDVLITSPAQLTIGGVKHDGVVIELRRFPD